MGGVSTKRIATSVVRVSHLFKPVDEDARYPVIDRERPDGPSGQEVRQMRALFVVAMLGLGFLKPIVEGQAGPNVPASLSQLAWLAGSWSGGEGQVSIEERWTSPAGGAMLAVSRTVKGDRMVAFEFLRIVERDGTLFYIAQPTGRPPTEFRLSAIAADGATFENKAHDFPKMITYAKKGDGTLEARVSDGGQRGETFLFRAVK
jgi:hypothetical protein